MMPFDTFLLFTHANCVCKRTQGLWHGCGCSFFVWLLHWWCQTFPWSQSCCFYWLKVLIFQYHYYIIIIIIVANMFLDWKLNKRPSKMRLIRFAREWGTGSCIQLLNFCVMNSKIVSSLYLLFKQDLRNQPRY